MKSVDVDLQRLEAMFGSAPYRDAGFAVLPPISGTAGEITDRLTEIFETLVQQDRMVLLIWSGHGETPGGRDLRLATYESYQPMTPGDGLAPAELVNKLASSGATALCLVLDVCQAGAAGGVVAETAARRFLEQPLAEGKFPGMAALFSAHGYETADDGLFADVMVRVLRDGPSRDAQARIAEEGFGGFNLHNRLLTMTELEAVLGVEFELLKDQNAAVQQTPVGQHVGRLFGLFPNPLFKPGSPPVSVDVARRQWLRKQDVEAHFLPKARGLEPGEEGWFFSGRSTVSRQILEWLDARGEAGANNLYVLTGDGGTGKSSIIGRIVALSDQDFRDEARRAGWDEGIDAAEGTVPTVGRIDSALHLRNLSAEGAAAALSDLLRIPPPDPALGLSGFVFNAPAQLPDARRPPTVILDALDEASEPARLAEQLIKPLAAKGWRILVGTRPSRGAVDLLDHLGPAHRRNLDTEPTSEKDIEQYVKQRLSSTPDSPYAAAAHDTAVVAARVAANANGRFLYARITASGLLRRARVDLANLDDELGANVGEAFARDLAAVDDRFRVSFNRTDRGATTILEALAWAEGEGLPLRDELWSMFASAIAESGDRYTDAHVQWVLREGGRYVLESGDGDQAVYRLFHQSLNEHFRERRDAPAVEHRIASALWTNIERGNHFDHNAWDLANPYLVRHLPAHLRSEPERLEELCTNPWYLRRAFGLLGVDRLAELLARANRVAHTPAIEAVAKAVRRARVALSRDPMQLAAQLHARLSSEDNPALRRLIGTLPAVAPRVWLRDHTASLGWRAELGTMQTLGAKVRALAFGTIDGTAVIAIGTGTNVYLWDPRSSQPGQRIIGNDDLRVTGLAVGSVAGREVVAVAAGYDNQLVIRDAQTGAIIGDPMPGGAGTLAIGRAEGREMVAIAYDGARVIARSIDSKGEMIERYYQAYAVGQIGGALMTVERVGADRYQVINRETGQSIGPAIDAPKDMALVAVGAAHGQPVLCFATYDGNGEVRDVQSGEPLGKEVAFDFRMRTLVVGEVEGELIVAAGNDADLEGGYVAIRQPMTLETSCRRLDAALQRRRILGAGIADRGKEGFEAHHYGGRLILLLEGAGAVDPITSETVAPAPDPGVTIQVFSGEWSVPATITEPAPQTKRHITLRKERPMEWPIFSEAWGKIGRTLVQARGSYAGAVWIFDAERTEIVHGPFVEIGPTTIVSFGTKGVDSRVSGVALGTWEGRGAVAVAHLGRAAVFDIEAENPLGSPKTGQSHIVAVALGNLEENSILATGSDGGAVTIWEGPPMRRLASVTLDAGVSGLWLAGSVLAARTVDNRFHVFDVVVSA